MFNSVCVCVGERQGGEGEGEREEGRQRERWREGGREREQGKRCRERMSYASMRAHTERDTQSHTPESIVGDQCDARNVRDKTQKKAGSYLQSQSIYLKLTGMLKRK